MEKTEAPNHGEIADISNVILYFGSFKLEKDGNLEPRTTAASQTNNVAAAAAAAPIRTPAEDAANASNSNIMKNCHAVEEASGQNRTTPEKSVLGNGNIWGHNFFMSRGNNSRMHQSLDFAEQESAQDVSLMKLQYFKDSHLNLPKPDYPSNSENIFLENWRPNPNSHHEDIEEFTDFTSSGRIYSGADYASTKMKTNSGDATKPLFDLSLLQEILDDGDYEEISMLLILFQGSYCDLMTDKSLSFIFLRLINACRDNHLEFVIADLLSCSHSFISAAFCRIGSSSIIKLIKRLKESALALSIVQMLSTQFFPIMTHETAKSVIQQCFISLPYMHNEMLYEEAILYCLALATDSVGCRSLNQIINTICGEQRSRLLNTIADSSVYLSNHEYGNYVVQNVLNLKDDQVIARIVLSLRGRFVKLGLQQGGSHVVEKCIGASVFGLVAVVKEIIETPEASFDLARDQFGNYVIQRALKKAKKNRFRHLYECLVKSLEPYRRELNLSMGGKIVLGLINEDVGFKWGRNGYRNWKIT